MESSTTADGKHGHAKTHFVAVGIFNGKKYYDHFPSQDMVDVPVVRRSEYTLIDLPDDGYLVVMDAHGRCREDISFPSSPQSLGAEIRTAVAKTKDCDDKVVMMCVLSAMGQEQVVAVKIVKD